MELVLLLVLLVVLVRLPKRQPQAGDVGWLLPALRMLSAVLIVGGIGYLAVQLF